MEWYKTLDIHTRINIKKCFYTKERKTHPSERGWDISDH